LKSAASAPTLASRRDFLFLRPWRPASDYWVRLFRKAMACRFEITLSAEDASHLRAASDALDLTERIEAMLSHFRQTSDLARLNRSAAGGPVRVAPEILELLGICRRIHDDTGGAFDATTTPVSRVWGFLERSGRVPAATDLEAARASVGLDKVLVNEAEGLVRFAAPGVEVSFGGIGKGWALDRMAAGLRVRGVERALLSAGGSSFRALGGESGEFVVDVCGGPAGPLARAHLADAALGVSTSAEQFFESEGRRYGHVLDPRTGRPASGTRVAAVVARDAAEADAVATALLVDGAPLAERYCAAHAGVSALVAPDGDGPARRFGGDAERVFELS
jgi:FAD:protein FMN transferase